MYRGTEIGLVHCIVKRNTIKCNVFVVAPSIQWFILEAVRPLGERDSSRLQNVKTGYEAYIISYPVGNIDYLRWGKTADTLSWAVTFIKAEVVKNECNCTSIPETPDRMQRD
jgi:hypothetical protein